MAVSPKESAEDGITEEEMAATSTSLSRPEQSSSNLGKPNAFAELMSRKPKPVTDTSNKPQKSASRFIAGRDRDGLAAYTKDPAAFPPTVVLHADDNWVVIHDMFPKAIVHLLLLPRNPAINSQHPFDALFDPDFLASAKAEASKWRNFAASELRHLFGSESAMESTRRAALEAEELPSDGASLPPGRDWAQEVRVGIHAHPSMNHLHIHVISQDMYSEKMKHRKHYNSFKTPFFVDIDEFPLADDDKRRHPGREGYLQSDLKCWRCGKNFGNAFARLKDHIAEEFVEWKKE
ncbi:HIT-like protein [Viridothelium virens]|uniref:Aprataxin-like protein n=1 Tax=Viridothelium virens TaxID=1048519 RepID=A0A6A6HLL9_VIRVR|nr:HIT-like protein [Viridothelium virens]